MHQIISLAMSLIVGRRSWNSVPSNTSLFTKSLTALPFVYDKAIITYSVCHCFWAWLRVSNGMLGDLNQTQEP